MTSIDYAQASVWLPLFFFVAMGFAMLSYVVLDGYDLGIGMLLNRATAVSYTHLTLPTILRV